MTLRAHSEPPPTKKKEKTWSMKETVDWQNKRWKGQSWRNWEEPDPNIKEENTNYPKNVRSPLKKSSPSGISKEEYEQQKKEMLRAMSERPEKEPKRTQEVRTVPESPKTKEKSEVLLKAKPKAKAEEKSKATSAGSARRPEMKSEEKTDEKPQAKAKRQRQDGQLVQCQTSPKRWSRSALKRSSNSRVQLASYHRTVQLGRS